jgi:hypothetical protein
MTIKMMITAAKKVKSKVCCFRNEYFSLQTLYRQFRRMHWDGFLFSCPKKTLMIMLRAVFMKHVFPALKQSHGKIIICGRLLI